MFLRHTTIESIINAPEGTFMSLMGVPAPQAIINEKGEPEIKWVPKIYRLLITEETRKVLLDLNESLGEVFPPTY
jgi:hypothetical protein